MGGGGGDSCVHRDGGINGGMGGGNGDEGGGARLRHPSGQKPKTSVLMRVPETC